jgi:hypothetical protein
MVVAAPDRAEEQGETPRLGDSGGDAAPDSCMADQLRSRSQPSENRDSREDARLETRLEASLGLCTLKSAAGLFATTPEPDSAPGQTA